MLVEGEAFLPLHLSKGPATLLGTERSHNRPGVWGLERSRVAPKAESEPGLAYCALGLALEGAFALPPSDTEPLGRTHPLSFVSMALGRSAVRACASKTLASLLSASSASAWPRPSACGGLSTHRGLGFLSRRVVHLPRVLQGSGAQARGVIAPMGLPFHWESHR